MPVLLYGNLALRMTMKEEYIREKQKFICLVGTAAVKDWHLRHICLPSVVTALAAEGTEWGKSPVYQKKKILFPYRYDGEIRAETISKAVWSHNNYLAAWKWGNQQRPNWEKLVGKEYYILAVQYLQRAEYPYCFTPDFEEKLIDIIETYQLMKLDD